MELSKGLFVCWQLAGLRDLSNAPVQRLMADLLRRRSGVGRLKLASAAPSPRAVLIGTDTDHVTAGASVPVGGDLSVVVVVACGVKRRLAAALVVVITRPFTGRAGAARSWLCPGCRRACSDVVRRPLANMYERRVLTTFCACASVSPSVCLSRCVLVVPGHAGRQM